MPVNGNGNAWYPISIFIERYPWFVLKAAQILLMPAQLLLNLRNDTLCKYLKSHHIWNQFWGQGLSRLYTVYWVGFWVIAHKPHSRAAENAPVDCSTRYNHSPTRPSEEMTQLYITLMTGKGWIVDYQINTWLKMTFKVICCNKIIIEVLWFWAGTPNTNWSCRYIVCCLNFHSHTESMHISESYPYMYIIMMVKFKSCIHNLYLSIPISHFPFTC